MPELLQSQPSVCGFYTTYAAFHQFEFRQKEITGVHEVKVLSNKSNYMKFFNLFNVDLPVVQRFCYFVLSCTLLITFLNLKLIFLQSVKSKRYRERKWLKTRAVFLYVFSIFLMVGLSFYGLRLYCKGLYLLFTFRHCFFRIATFELLKSLR